MEYFNLARLQMIGAVVCKILAGWYPTTLHSLESNYRGRGLTAMRNFTLAEKQVEVTKNYIQGKAAVFGRLSCFA
ncbi:hypothetical protein FHS21_004959 [Phyllobacterium trifolii]|uniref:Uncharacterized protein n=1 Tax=Phyllobacterium trifolii TaxID=300193 RepID=A0A839UIR2_9HYPH|nr:hypothetical protein [Phyllobacterium trifolii]